jgi:hypothetical protein
MCPGFFRLRRRHFPTGLVRRILRMTTSSITTRRLLAGGFAIAIAITPAVALVAQPTHSVPLAACDAGEEEDTFTTVCTPFMVPNSPGGFTTTAANPDIPEVSGVPCTGGRSSGACIGLEENAEDMGPQPVPRSTISSSP